MEQPFTEIMRIARKHMGSASRASTVKVAMEEIQALGPEAVHNFVKQFGARYSSREFLDKELDREREVDRIKRDLGWDPDPPSILAPGVPGDALGLETFQVDPKHPTLKEALESTQRWLKGTAPGMLVLAGAPGVGKTHLARAAVGQLQGLERSAVYRQEARLIGELQEFMGGGSPSVEECLVEYGSMKWLVIDEFGGTHTRDWGSGVMDRIINDRWENSGCRTLITTNLLAEDMPVRIKSRLGDVQRVKAIVIKAPDYRQRRR